MFGNRPVAVLLGEEYCWDSVVFVYFLFDGAISLFNLKGERPASAPERSDFHDRINH